MLKDTTIQHLKRKTEFITSLSMGKLYFLAWFVSEQHRELILNRVVENVEIRVGGFSRAGVSRDWFAFSHGSVLPEWSSSGWLIDRLAFSNMWTDAELSLSDENRFKKVLMTICHHSYRRTSNFLEVWEHFYSQR